MAPGSKLKSSKVLDAEPREQPVASLRNGNDWPLRMFLHHPQSSWAFLSKLRTSARSPNSRERWKQSPRLRTLCSTKAGTD
jgi:hypothetical protein